ncbi:hypothetical protein PF005_g26784 [Phytophthora fragariae]|uniref:Secreted protein n=1 Tax=Phytophthora fragariae TaxID=53985 RepID=A0A6A4BM12_9STRA|nr:hypothetical protein PF003_g31644 [Phytophthora fragariae]KAE8921385.1 hypothetical protein PF009_g28338 [Phytophthora fragariae]KAE9064503.1 hypothetical protein PF010_g28584 [Phytophthora fragariae]KAE9069153.1 hypothetical protein PF007_g27430 [Phytophthora fragariae]KAE9079687.1 hypothetical protein PF006_g27465 [Phytophthora fragariae]
MCCCRCRLPAWCTNCPCTVVRLCRALFLLPAAANWTDATIWLCRMPDASGIVAAAVIKLTAARSGSRPIHCTKRGGGSRCQVDGCEK